MTFETFYEGVSSDWNVCVVHPDNTNCNVCLKKGHDYGSEWINKHKDRFIKSICKVVVEGAGGFYGYDVELIPEGEPEQDVIFEEYERQGAIPW